MTVVLVHHFKQTVVKCQRTKSQMAGLSIKGVESDHHITGAFERSRRHPHIHTTAVHDHVRLELLFEACKSHVLVCAEKNRKRRRCWEKQRDDDEVDSSLLYFSLDREQHEEQAAKTHGTSWAENRPKPNLSSLLVFTINLHNFTFSPCAALRKEERPLAV